MTKRPVGEPPVSSNSQPKAGRIERDVAKAERRPAARKVAFEKVSTARFEEAERQLRRLFGKNVREARLRSEMTQAEVGAIIGNHQTYVAKIERGEQNVTLEVITRIAYAVRTDPGALLLGESAENYSLETLIRIVAALHRHLQDTYDKVGNAGFQSDMMTIIPRLPPSLPDEKEAGRSKKK